MALSKSLPGMNMQHKAKAWCVCIKLCPYRLRSFRLCNFPTFQPSDLQQLYNILASKNFFIQPLENQKISPYFCSP